MGLNHQLRHDYLLGRILAGELTPAEREEQLVIDDSQLLHLKIRIFDQIHQSKVILENPRRMVLSAWRGHLMRVAAILFIPLLIGSLWVVNRMSSQMEAMTSIAGNQRVVANPGSRVHFTLPDESEVWLNSGSSLEFPISLAQLDFRKVKLSGQGYFKVAHDREHPFIVQINDMNVKALGTSFDVSSYAEDKQISSTLEEGSIALLTLEGVEMARLHPGQKAFLDRTTKEILVKEVETSLTTSWKDGKLIFRNSSLTDVTTQLERWFNCNIHVDSRLLSAGLMYTATIQDETLGEVLKMIEISTKIKTRIEKREVYLDIKK
jgi:transmembrane sensor